MDDDQTRLQLDIQREYVEFIDDTNDQGIYIEKIKDMVRKSSQRLIININDLRKRLPVRCTRLLDNGFDELPIAMKAVREVVATVDSEYAKSHDEFYIGFEGSFGAKHVTPRSLTSRHLANTVCIEGIVTKCSIIRPKVVRSVHYCPATKKSMERKYNDITSFDVFPSVNIYPTKDDDGNLLETEYGLSKYRDHQTLTIQEMPEKAPTGQLPRSVDVFLDNDLVDLCKPGDRVLIVGVYRCLPGKQGGFTTGIFRTMVLGNSVTKLSKDANLTINVDDVKECKKFSKTTNPFDVLAKSLAPTIYGHEQIKKAVLCLLLGGVEKVLPNGTRLRGDINVLLIGDPSVAKSQMLRYVANVAPRVIMTTGRGSSGVGLTAAVTTDMETGDRRLEAGAMVLADRGIVCIDEFDKMSDADRTSIHEVMEQGRVTIAKAGIHARLNARTAVLAAANPVYGRYDPYKTPMDNIGLQDSLLSRFDLLFTILDEVEQERDRTIADHVLRIHRFRNAGEQDGEATPLFENDQTLSTADLDEEQRKGNEKTSTYEKHDPLLHGKRGRRDKILSMEFMKKYIHIAKCIKPVLSSEASRVIADEYTKLRQKDNDSPDMGRTQPITARTLETLIRLSTAHAKARMSKLITREDAQNAIDLIHFAVFRKVMEKEKKRRRAGNESEDDGVDGDSGNEGGNDDENREGSQRPKRSRQQPADQYDLENNTEEAVGTLKELRRAANRDAGQPDSEEMDTEESEQPSGTISDSRYTLFKQRLAAMFSNERAESLPMPSIVETMQQHEFEEDEVEAGIAKMNTEGKVVYSEGIVFII
ncbi:DNA replication licensing factor Mcm3 [Orchesella cincta]|uniref:DNA replication licensing factor MCM3 n=1 Tax=Orchesella cincta TaxID=48709 RepID=A0A1D2N8F5_ORCCI|nr:DNA replication licensing factor Mcm3 [Orchesella cincta]